MSDPWVRFFPSDWLAGTRGMTAAETGVYITLVCLMYEKGAPIEREDARQARLVGVAVVTFRKILQTLISEGKITEIDGALFNSRVSLELKNREEISEAARSKANARWEKPKQKQGTRDAAALHRHSPGNANHNHNHNTPKSPRAVAALRPAAIEAAATRKVSRELEPDLWAKCCAASGHKPTMTDKEGAWTFEINLIAQLEAA